MVGHLTSLRKETLELNELYQKIIDTYNETGSVKDTANALNTYPIKVRRVLITEGLWHSKTSDQIGELLNQGLCVSEIAKKLYISEKNVQSFMPYSRGQYGGANRSNEAIRSEEYRERMQIGANNQVNKTEALPKNPDNKIAEQKKTLEKLMVEKEQLLKEKRAFWNTIEADMKRIPIAMEIHLELDMDYLSDEDHEVLKKYGRMDKSISRDFIVPGSITLHGLHYAILKAFGWQNSHLHCFIPTEEDFRQMTNGNKVSEWIRLVGMYFRFPGDNFEDIYWDDDYEGDISFKSWLKSKYCGPYYYGGTGEYYIPSQIEVEDFKKRYPEILNKSTDQREWGVTFDGSCEELIERSLLASLLKDPSNESDWNSWNSEKEAAIAQIEPELEGSLNEFSTLIQKLYKIQDEINALMQKKEYPDSEVLLPYMDQLDELDSDLDELVLVNDPEPVPALSSLIYRYDYGDDWKIKITCTNAWFDHSTFARDEEGNMLRNKNGFIREKSLYEDAFGNEITGEFLEKIKTIRKKEKPVCTAWDGMNLVDDVGGIGGFCDFLRAINGDDPEEKQSNKTWAKSLGWTGRMSKPENVL